MYTFNSKVRYSETDERGNLAVSSIINYFQDCSTFQSEQLGVGVKYLEEAGRVWMITNWHVVIDNELQLGDNIKIGTWPYGFDKLFGYRNFAIYDEKEEMCVKADSKWILFDVSKGRPVKIAEEDHSAYECEPAIDMEKMSRKIRVPEDSTKGEPFIVRHYHLDTNGHVNNGKYVQMAMEFVDAGKRITEFYVEYKNQAMLGDTIVPYICHNDNETIIVLMEENEKDIYAIIEFKYDMEV